MPRCSAAGHLTLNEKEIDALNKTVMAYPDIAEVHALNPRTDVYERLVENN